MRPIPLGWSAALFARLDWSPGPGGSMIGAAGPAEGSSVEATDMLAPAQGSPPEPRALHFIPTRSAPATPR